MREIKRAAVLGSGVMGEAIAGLLANCGVPCLMLDIVPPNVSEADKMNRDKRNSLAAASKAALTKTRPSPVYSASVVDLIEVGNFEDDFHRIAECDWICEVVKEDLAIKRSVLEKVARFRTKGSIVSTNTSGIPLRSMAEGMDADMSRHFLGAHFFNPPRFLKLLEIISGPDTLPEVIEGMARFGEDVLGKGIVYAKDTPNFVANRILTFTTGYIMGEMLKDGLTFEAVDALTGPAIGHASSATFRTADLVGLDTLVRVMGNVYNGCPDDERRDVLVPPDYVQKMIDKGLYGTKSGSGFYKKTAQRDAKGRAVILSLDPDSLEYRPPTEAAFPCLAQARKAASLEDKIRIMHTADDPGARFVWKVFANTAVYAANRIPEMADDIVNIDNAVKWGFAWERGIFETWDILGFDAVCNRMEADGLTLPPIAQAMKAAGVSRFYHAEDGGGAAYFDLAANASRRAPENPKVIVLDNWKKRANAVIQHEEDASLIDLGDGILCVEFHSKMNTIGSAAIQLVEHAIGLINDGQYAGMVLGNQGPHFSAGADLTLVLTEAKQENWEGLRRLVTQFQNVNMAMRFCKGPVVAAPHHYTFGGGIEMSQHAARVVFAGETYGGLVEAGVGLIPAGGGTKEMLRRALAFAPESVPEVNPFPYVRRAFETIAMGKTSASGPELIDLGYFTAEDVVCVNLDQQIRRAKDMCLGLVVSGYRPPVPATLRALGDPARVVVRSGLYNLQQGGFASDHDVAVAMAAAYILTGGDRMPGARMTEQDVLDLECEQFLRLCGMAKTRERMEHMLSTGKPLRN